MNNSSKTRSSDAIKLGGKFTFPGTSMTVHRMGYGAMQLAGPGVFGASEVCSFYKSDRPMRPGADDKEWIA